MDFLERFCIEAWSQIPEYSLYSPTLHDTEEDREIAGKLELQTNTCRTKPHRQRPS